MARKQRGQIILFGVPKTEVQMWNDFTGEIVFRCDVEYLGTRYDQLSILRLSIQRKFGEINIVDAYPHCIPYLKAIPSFRTYLIRYMQVVAHPTFPQITELPLESMQAYLEELRKYDDVKEIIRQAETSVSRLRPEDPAAEARARAILAAMGQTPGCDVRIEFVA